MFLLFIMIFVSLFSVIFYFIKKNGYYGLFMYNYYKKDFKENKKKFSFILIFNMLILNNFAPKKIFIQ
ncbi:MAG: hypothetical protein KatS3mg035_2023 [Bacteroidia bacterium]|nr:MAG: hypothetical protein KatS3mg035_2023 [Bacteroidia bacterium]